MDGCQANQFQLKTVKMCHKYMLTVATETTVNRTILGGTISSGG